MLPHTLAKPEGPWEMWTSSCNTWVLTLCCSSITRQGCFNACPGGLCRYSHCQWFPLYGQHPMGICCSQLLPSPCGSTVWSSHGQQVLQYLPELQVSSCSPRFVRCQVLSPYTWLKPSNSSQVHSAHFSSCTCWCVPFTLLHNSYWKHPFPSHRVLPQVTQVLPSLIFSIKRVWAHITVHTKVLKLLAQGAVDAQSPAEGRDSPISE